VYEGEAKNANHMAVACLHEHNSNLLDHRSSPTSYGQACHSFQELETKMTCFNKKDNG
jgi:hypothetical protein